MKLETISGVHRQGLRCFRDERGSILRLFDATYFEAGPQVMSVSYTLLSCNAAEGTLRGLHYQEPPDSEHKFISCISGSIFLVVLDLRCESESYLMSASSVLTVGEQAGIYVPAGVALGWMTLENDTNVHYSIQGKFNHLASRGVRFDDPILNINWPSQPRVISERDLSWPPFHESDQDPA